MPIFPVATAVWFAFKVHIVELTAPEPVFFVKNVRADYVLPGHGPCYRSIAGPGRYS